MQKSLFICSAICFALLLGLSCEIKAQTARCGLFISVTKKIENNTKQFVKDSLVQLTNLVNGKTTVVDLDENTGMFLATKLKNGNYKLVVTRKEFKRAVQNLKVPCQSSVTLFTDIELQSGNSKQSVISKATAKEGNFTIVNELENKQR